MWRFLALFRALWLSTRIFIAWQRDSPEVYRNWLMLQRKQQAYLTDPLQIQFVSLWISRLFSRLVPQQCCVLASSCLYVLVALPVKLSFGVKKMSINHLAAHAWAEWPGGQLQLDSKTQYEALWEIGS